MSLNYEQFIELTEMIAPLFPKLTSDEESDIPQTSTFIDLKISWNWREFSFIEVH